MLCHYYTGMRLDYNKLYMLGFQPALCIIVHALYQNLSHYQNLLTHILLFAHT